SVAVRESAFGNASIMLVDTLNSLAVAYRTRGDVDQAQPLLERALRILDGTPPFLNGLHVDTLNSLAWTLLSIGDEEAALKLFSQAKDQAEKQPASLGVPFALSLNGLLFINARRGNIAEALSLSERSLAILEKTLGQSDPTVAA